MFTRGYALCIVGHSEEMSLRPLDAFQGLWISPELAKHRGCLKMLGPPQVKRKFNGEDDDNPWMLG